MTDWGRFFSCHFWESSHSLSPLHSVLSTESRRSPSPLFPLPSPLSPLPSHLSPLPSHLFPLTSSLSPLTSPLSPLTSHLSMKSLRLANDFVVVVLVKDDALLGLVTGA